MKKFFYFFGQSEVLCTSFSFLFPMDRTVRTFFARTKKVPKKYAEGLRALSTPGNAVKFLRFDGDTGNFALCGNAKNAVFLYLLATAG